VALANVNEAYDKSAPGNMRSEFSWTKEASRSQKFATFSGELTTDMHEVIGHASGKQARQGQPAAADQRFSPLSRKGADLAGLYFIADPKLVELGVIRRPIRQHRARRIRGIHAKRAGQGGASAKARRSRKTHAQPADDRPVADGNTRRSNRARATASRIS
jgi:hypothetical protein